MKSGRSATQSKGMQALLKPLRKKLANHEHAFALFSMHYNFVRIHKTLRVTPAMEAGVADHVWTLEEIASLTD